MPRKTGRRVCRRIAENTVFRQITHHVRRYQRALNEDAQPAAIVDPLQGAAPMQFPSMNPPDESSAQQLNRIHAQAK